MKTLNLILAVLLSVSAFAGTLVVEGTYQQKNVFVVNPVSADGVGFCVYEVRVNDKISSDEVNSQAFEVDLTQYKFKLGDDVVIKIMHKDDCAPRILNPGALEPRPTFEVANIEINSDGLLKWQTSNEQGQLPFLVQQYKWFKWVTVGEVMGEGSSTTNSYNFQTIPTSGLNRFRVVQKAQDGKTKKSPAAEYTNDTAPVQFEYAKKSQQVTFSSSTSFEIYDEYGRLVKKGFGSEVDVKSLKKGTHYLSFDSITAEFVKK